MAEKEELGSLNRFNRAEIQKGPNFNNKLF